MNESSVRKICKRVVIEKMSSIRPLGRPRALSEHARRRMGREIKKKRSMTARRLKENLHLEVSTRTIQRELLRAGFKCKKLQKKPALNAGHRKQFALRHIAHTDWFTDEKKFNLDGPDGYAYYWHHYSDQPDAKFISKSFSPKKGIMVWGAICVSRP